VLLQKYLCPEACFQGSINCWQSTVHCRVPTAHLQNPLTMQMGALVSHGGVYVLCGLMPDRSSILPRNSRDSGLKRCAGAKGAAAAAAGLAASALCMAGIVCNLSDNAAFRTSPIAHIPSRCNGANPWC
jgi:hypothetical protein